MIYDQLEPGKPVWDVCCDHGHIGLWAQVSGLFPEVHFVDQAAHLVEKLEALFLERLGPGPWEGVGFHGVAAENLHVPVTGNLVIAGVGGITAREIIEGLHEDGCLQASRLILAPHGDEEWLKESDCLIKNYALHSVHSVVEKRRERSIFVYTAKS